MNNIKDTFLLGGDKLMSEMHIKQPGVTYSAFETFTENEEQLQKCKEAGNSRYNYRDELGNCI